MLKRLRVQNFLSLRDTTVHLSSPLVLVGPNGAGKSAIVKALMLFSMALRVPMQVQRRIFRFGTLALDRVVWNGDDRLPLVFQAWFREEEADRPDYELRLEKIGGNWRVVSEVIRLANLAFDSSNQVFEFGTEYRGIIQWKAPMHATLPCFVRPYERDQVALQRIRPLLELPKLVGNTWRYRVAASDIGKPVRPAPDAPEPFHVAEDGWALPAVLRRLQGEDRATFDKIERKLAQWFPEIRQLAFEETSEGVRLSFAHAGWGTPVPAELEADGVLHALFLIWRGYTARQEDRICVEEPENGTHPYLLAERYEFIRSIAGGELNQYPVPVVVTTHSPELLNAIGCEEALGVVQVVERHPDNGTSVHRLRDMDQVQRLFEVFKGQLGELWWSGALGGVPRTADRP